MYKRQGLVKWIGDEVLDAYYDAVADKSVNNLTDEQIANAPLKLVYTPVSYTHLRLRLRILPVRPAAAWL